MSNNNLNILTLEKDRTKLLKKPSFLPLRDITHIDQQLFDKFSDRIVIDNSLTRQLVSFQANKQRAYYRWYKYKEAFSAKLVELLFQRYSITKGRVLDPFAGVGTTLFAAAECGMAAEGIELLPLGYEIVRSRLLIDKEFSDHDFAVLKQWINNKPWKEHGGCVKFLDLRITKGAYPRETYILIEQYLSAIQNESSNIQAVLKMALLCILESISYTRKDGQYLRWDYRSGRRQGNRPFDKGLIKTFDDAIISKIEEILHDAQGGDLQSCLFRQEKLKGDICILSGSCLDILPRLNSANYDAIMTSPPYCNRYDYTRTYALELALLGVGEKEIASLRQTMLSCTVENKPKNIISLNPNWAEIVRVTNEQHLLKAILSYLDYQRELNLLNNKGIPRMVQCYFDEMACVIWECARVLKKNGLMFMVNDNVRYAGVSISVDLILSSFAEKMGFSIEKILVLPNNKGNSSQQMGLHGRDALRKCVYIWRKK